MLILFIYFFLLPCWFCQSILHHHKCDNSSAGHTVPGQVMAFLIYRIDLNSEVSSAKGESHSLESGWAARFDY